MQISKRNPVPRNISKTFFWEVADGCTSHGVSPPQLRVNTSQAWHIFVEKNPLECTCCMYEYQTLSSFFYTVKIPPLHSLHKAGDTERNTASSLTVAVHRDMTECWSWTHATQTERLPCTCMFRNSRILAIINEFIFDLCLTDGAMTRQLHQNLKYRGWFEEFPLRKYCIHKSRSNRWTCVRMCGQTHRCCTFIIYCQDWLMEFYASDVFFPVSPLQVSIPWSSWLSSSQFLACRPSWAPVRKAAWWQAKQEVAEDHLRPPRKAGEVAARNLAAVGEVEVRHREEEVVEVAAECQHGRVEEEGEGEGGGSRQVEAGEEAAAEEGVPLHPLVRVVEVVLRAQLDPPQSANTGEELLLADTSASTRPISLLGKSQTAEFGRLAKSSDSRISSTYFISTVPSCKQLTRCYQFEMLSIWNDLVQLLNQQYAHSELVELVFVSLEFIIVLQGSLHDACIRIKTSGIIICNEKPLQFRLLHYSNIYLVILLAMFDRKTHS